MMDLSKLKIKLNGTGNFQPPDPVPLDAKTEVGVNVIYNGIVGLLINSDGKKATIRIHNGQTVAVEIG